MIETLSSSLLLESILFSAVFALVLLFRFSLGRTSHPSVRKLLWLPLGLFLVLPFWNPVTGAIGRIAFSLSPRAHVLEQRESKLDMSGMEAGEIQSAATAMQINTRRRTSALVSSGLLETAARLEGANLDLKESLPLGVQLAGYVSLDASAFCLLFVALSFAWLSSAIARSGRGAAPETEALFREELQRVIPGADIRLLAVNGPVGTLHPPFAFGMLNPCIVIPDGIERNLSPDQLRFVLRHELCHVRSCDSLLRILALCTAALYCLNPFAWIALVLFSRDAEDSCDRACLEGSDNSSLGYVIFTNDNGLKIISEMRMYQEDNFYCLGSLKIGSTLEEAVALLGEPSSTVDGVANDWEEDVLYKNIDGTTSRHYYNNSSNKIRVFFGENAATGVCPHFRAILPFSGYKLCMRKERRILEGAVYHVTARTNRKEMLLGTPFPRELLLQVFVHTKENHEARY